MNIITRHHTHRISMEFAHYFNLPVEELKQILLENGSIETYEAKSHLVIAILITRYNVSIVHKTFNLPS